MNDVSHGGEYLDDVLHCLANETRRRILAELRATGREAGVETEFLAATIASTNAAELHHVHLPSLEHAGLIERGRDADAVYRGPRFDDAEPLFEALERMDAVAFS